MARGRRAKDKEEKQFAAAEHAAEQANENEQMPFFGKLNSEEQGYFKQAEQQLNLNTFENPEVRQGFIGGVFDEAKGKELKLSTNQICSKLMERLVLVSNEEQVHQLYDGFKGFLYQCCIHKYASHVVETLFVRLASMVEKEMARRDEEDYEQKEESEDVTMEKIVLEFVQEVKPKLREMAYNKYASHVLRLLLLILAGRKLPSSIESNSILRSKKSKIARKMVEIEDNEDYERSFAVPSSFKEVLKEIITSLGSDETTESLREWAIDPVASPVLQLLIRLEGLVDRDRTFFTRTFAPANEEKSDKEGAFMEYLLSDPVGSHFLESALDQQKVKNIDRLYTNYIEERLETLAKRETTGAFVVQSLLSNAKPKQQKAMLDRLVPILNELIVNNMGLGGSMVDASQRNGGYLKEEIVDKLFEFFNRDANGEQQKDVDVLENLLQLSHSTMYSKKDDWPTSEERRRAIFLEKLVAFDGRFRTAVTEAILAMKDEDLVKMCEHGVFSHTVESCLVHPMETPIVTRRLLLNKFVPYVTELACNAQGSHIVDKLDPLSFKLNMFKDRIAKQLKDNEETVKRTVYGRQVWKNWFMEDYSRRFGDWKRRIKQHEIDYEAKHADDTQSGRSYSAYPMRKRQQRAMAEPHRDIRIITEVQTRSRKRGPPSADQPTESSHNHGDDHKHKHKHKHRKHGHKDGKTHKHSHGDTK